MQKYLYILCALNTNNYFVRVESDRTFGAGFTNKPIRVNSTGSLCTKDFQLSGDWKSDIQYCKSSTACYIRLASILVKKKDKKQ